MKKLILFSIILLVIDILWISQIMSQLYKGVFAIQLKPVAALIAYSAMILGYYVFIYKLKSNLMDKICKAFLLGMVIYATYGFTLAAIYDKYPMSLAITETIWGSCLFASVTYLTNKILT